MRSLARCLTLGLVFAAIVVVRSASPAYACSCVAIDTQMRQPETFPFDAAFVGRVSEAPPVNGIPGLVSWTFLVDEVYRGDLPPIVEVKAAVPGAECGFGPISVGSELGLLLRRDGDDWIAGACSSGAPARFALLGPPQKPTDAPSGIATVNAALEDEPDDGGVSTGAIVAIGGPVIVTAAVAVAATALGRRRAR